MLTRLLLELWIRFNFLPGSGPGLSTLNIKNVANIKNIATGSGSFIWPSAYSLSQLEVRQLRYPGYVVTRSEAQFKAKYELASSYLMLMGH